MRFVVRRRDRDSGVAIGAIQVAHVLCDRAEIAPSDREVLREVLEWFDTHLDTPERFNRTRSKGHYRRAPKGIAWLKASAGEHVAQMYRVKTVLDSYGHRVEVLRETRIGYIVWEDEHQAIAEPFADTRTE